MSWRQIHGGHVRGGGKRPEGQGKAAGGADASVWGRGAAPSNFSPPASPALPRGPGSGPGAEGTHLKPRGPLVTSVPFGSNGASIALQREGRACWGLCLRHTDPLTPLTGRLRPRPPVHAHSAACRTSAPHPAYPSPRPAARRPLPPCSPPRPRHSGCTRLLAATMAGVWAGSGLSPVGSGSGVTQGPPPAPLQSQLPPARPGPLPHLSSSDTRRLAACGPAGAGASRPGAGSCVGVWSNRLRAAGQQGRGHSVGSTVRRPLGSCLRGQKRDLQRGQPAPW